MIVLIYLIIGVFLAIYAMFVVNRSDQSYDTVELSLFGFTTFFAWPVVVLLMGFLTIAKIIKKKQKV